MKRCEEMIEALEDTGNFTEKPIAFPLTKLVQALPQAEIARILETCVAAGKHKNVHDGFDDTWVQD
jgi:hypothetical protein